MSRRSMLRAVLATAGLLAFAATSDAGAQEAFSIGVGSLDANGCFGQAACTVDAANVSTLSGVLSKKTNNGASGFGVSGGPSGSEIDIGETLRVAFGQPRSVLAIKFLFLYNGPEYADRAEKAKVIADGEAYTLSVRNDADDASADWSGPGTVSKCGATTSTGTGCFIVTDPFPAAVGGLDFTAIAGSHAFPLSGGFGSGESDYAIGFIDVAAQNVVELADCAGTAGCAVATVGGNVGFSLNSVQAANPGGSTEALVIPVRLPDCRYIPQTCLDMLPPAGDTAASDDARRALLIGLGVIQSLDPSGPDKLKPAAQLLNVTPLLPAEVTSLFDSSGTPPDGLPPMYVASRWRGQASNGFLFDGYFFKTDQGLVFQDFFEGLIDVSVLTGQELGCEADPDDLLAWDVISTVSELARSVGGKHRDTMINVGCINPTKVSGVRLSLYTINFEIVPDTFGPTIVSQTPKVTVNNDAVFARLVQSLNSDLEVVRRDFACMQADPAPSGGIAPLASGICATLKKSWSSGTQKLNKCIAAAFQPKASAGNENCQSFRSQLMNYRANLPASASGPDPANRLGELKARVEVIFHVFDTRFAPSIPAGGFCRERGTCSP